MKKNRKEIVEFINSLKGYEGYVQFSNRPIEDVWQTPRSLSKNTPNPSYSLIHAKIS